MIASFTFDNSGKRPRRITPKTRTGCRTCKARRIKCGEEKPYCLRCTSTGRTCEGYAQKNDGFPFSVIALEPIVSLKKSISTLQVTGNNVRHLEFYHHCASRRIASDFDRVFWSRTSLQMAQSEPCIRHALLAIGNLCESTTGSIKDVRFSPGTLSRQRIPLGHYNKAVDLLVKRMSEPSYANEIGLVACILFICIEFLRGEHMTALIHFTNGLNMVAASKQARTPSSADSTRHSMIEDILAPMFVRMMAIPIMNGIPTQLIADYPPSLRTIPFTSIREAQMEIHKIRNRTMQFTNDMLARISAGGAIGDFEYKTQSYLLDAHKAWLAAFEIFERKADFSGEELVTAHSLKASYYCTFIFAFCAPSGTQTSFDMHLDSFTAILYYAEIYLDMKVFSISSLPGANFTFDIEILPCICFTAQYCRDPATRRHAISLLERKSPREGLYDSESNVPVMKRLVEIEEEQVDSLTGWPVEGTRIWISVINGDMDEHGRFSTIFARGFWGNGKGLPKIGDGVVLSRENGDRLWREWFIV